MRTYLSIDCDYFASEEVSGEVSVQRLKDILQLLKNKPIYITLGHDLHVFDVNRHKVSRVINVDFHADCYSDISGEMEDLVEFYPEMSPGELLFEFSIEESLYEGNWLHYCMLKGKQTSIEHWKPRKFAERRLDYMKEVHLVSGVAKHESKIVMPTDLLGQIKAIQKDIVAVGIATSPDWCENVSHLERWDKGRYDWEDEFFGNLLPLVHDASLYSKHWAHKTIYCKEDHRRKLPQYRIPKKTTELVSGVWFDPVDAERCYTLRNNSYRIRISAKGTPPLMLGGAPHLPSIQKAAESFAQ